MIETFQIRSITQIAQQVDAYSASAPDESWMKSHQEAMACFDLEAYVSQGNHLFELILDIDTKWKGLVHAKKVEESREVAALMRGMLKKWIQPCASVETTIQRFEALGYRVEGAEKLRGHWNHARAILGGLPTTWRGRRILTESDLAQVDFPYPPEPE